MTQKKMAISKKTVIAIVVAVAVFVLCSCLPLQAYGEKAAVALGFFAAFIVLMFAQPWDMFITAMFVPVGGFLLGFWDWQTFQVSAGTSSFLQVMAFAIVGLGVETTPLGKRVAYYFLKIFGKKPAQMICVFAVITGLCSALISNTATLIMMSAIANGMLLAMGEKPGESRIGSCLMLLIAVMSFVGGSALYSGCIFANALGLSLIKTAATGTLTTFEMSYGQWAILGFPTFLITAVPICIIYILGSKVRSSKKTMLPKEYYETELKALGKIQGAEIRWIITVVCLIGCLLAGANTNVTALAFAVITLLPAVGTVPVGKVMGMLPLPVFFVLYFTSIFGELFTTTGLSGLFGDLIYPIFSSMGPYAFSVVVFLIMAAMQNVLINGAVASMSLVLAVSTPICIKLGYNPFVVLFPAICAGSYFFWIPLNANMLLNKGYGWWELKDSILPGALTLIFLGIVTPAIVLLLAPLAGLTVYL